MFVIQTRVPMVDLVKIMLETMDFSVCVVQVTLENFAKVLLTLVVPTHV